MALSDDQRAMLQLLLERGQTYDDLASVLGSERAEVRRRARAALTELAGTDPDQDVALSDYLLGQADPIARADVVRHLRGNADANALAGELAAKLQLLAPDAELPELPEGRGRRRAPIPITAAADGDDAEAVSAPTISSRQSRIMVAVGAAVVLLVVVVLAIAGVFSEDEAPPDPAADATTPSGSAATEDGTRVVLEPTSGSGEARGLVQLGFTNNDQGVVAGVLEGLPEPDRDHVYLLWFLNDDDRGFFLLQPIVVEKNGQGLLQAPVSAELLPLIQDARFIDISSLDKDQLKEAVNSFRNALENQADSIAYVGESILRGEIPRTDSGS